MAQIYDSLKALINPDMVSKAASLLEEDPHKVSGAVSSIVPGLLGVILKNGRTPQFGNILEEAGKLDIASNIEKVFMDKPSKKQQNIGDDFLQHLLGDKAANFTDSIAKESGISKVATNGLVSMIAPVVAGFLGQKMVKEGWSLSGLFSELNKEKSGFLNMIPSGLASGLGLTSLFNSDIASGLKVDKIKNETKGKFRWLIWVILLAALLLALFYIWKSCSKPVESAVIAVTDTVKEEATAVVDEVKEKIATELILPDGTKLNAYTDGIEDQMIAFLNSDEYKNSDKEQLKDKWFNFDNIEFKHGSGSVLTEESYPQLDNIVRILKYYKGTKVKIGGYTDKTGNADVNLKISGERANTIKAYLIKGGLDAATIGAEGYGDKFAKYPADAPDADRAHDRRIALRFVK
ncbi:MAG: DUF937 domain-containing protein [Prevotella sp.]|jgi:outer membrane protein OmpA-like peptidoglycan-associated protein|nr:DUF937 domain-containing protein [Prevotella sp.]